MQLPPDVRSQIFPSGQAQPLPTTSSAGPTLHGGASSSLPLSGVLDETTAFLDSVKPGWQTSEAQLTAGVLAALNLMYALFMIFAGSHLGQTTIDTVTAVDGAITAWLTANYAKGRVDVKAAVAAARLQSTDTSTGG